MASVAPPAAVEAPLQYAVACSVHARSEKHDCWLDVSVAEESAVAFRFNGFSHAVMMATPDDLKDFAYGFALTEGLIDDASDIKGVAIVPDHDGVIADVTLAGRALHRFLAARRVRHIRGRTSCGLCGVEDFVDISRPASRVASGRPIDPAAVEAAMHSLRAAQPLSRGTHAAHAAAWVSREGELVAVREDIGRHNALDKLIGAALRDTFRATDGFCLITSRCSYEIAQKAISAGFGALVSMSAPTALAVRTASAAGLALYSCKSAVGQLLYGTSLHSGLGTTHAASS